MDDVYVVTGATSGIGFVTASMLLRYGRVVALVRDAHKPLPDGVTRIIGDLSDLSDVPRAAAAIDGPVTALVNNAAIAFGAEDAIFRTNHLGPFLLTNLLIDRTAKVVSERLLTER
jgi:NAD(P)-dependent dehydrogenase (short-subunit alcohol dehydrogenase family)